MQDAIENNAYDDYREITSLHQVYDENMGGLFGKHRIFGKHSLFHRLIDKIRQHKGLRQKLLKVSSKAGEWLVKHLLGHVAPNVADKIADGIDTLAQKKIEKIDAEEGAMGQDIAAIRQYAQQYGAHHNGQQYQQNTDPKVRAEPVEDPHIKMLNMVFRGDNLDGETDH